MMSTGVPTRYPAARDVRRLGDSPDMGAYDGRRGWVYHLAIHPSYQGRGLGVALITHLEDRLRRKGCRKVNLLIEPDNAQVQHFYERLNYQRDDLIFLEKWLT